MNKNMCCEKDSPDAIMEHAVEEDMMNEVEWKRWQSLYAIARKKTFLGILEALRKHLPLS